MSTTAPTRMQPDHIYEHPQTKRRARVISVTDKKITVRYLDNDRKIVVLGVEGSKSWTLSKDQSYEKEEAVNTTTTPAKPRGGRRNGGGDVAAAAKALGEPPAVPATTTKPEVAWGANGETGESRLIEYLTENVSGDADAPEKGKPWINENGRVHFHSSWFIAWLQTKNVTGGKGMLTQPARDAQFVVRAVPIPGTGHSLGLYIGEIPAGKQWQPVRELPVRRAQRGGGGGGGFKASEPPTPEAGARVDKLVASIEKAVKAVPAGDTHDAEMRFIGLRLEALARRYKK